jgi:hypothetical protein
MTDLLREWNESAPYWDKYRDIMRAMFMPLTRALIEDAGVVKASGCSTLPAVQASRHSPSPKRLAQRVP